MATVRELYRNNSSTRTICQMLERAGPLTQTQISAAGEFTAGCACKCLKLLIEEGYVRRGPRAMSRQRNTIGPRPWTYIRTAKALPSTKTGRPATPTAQALCDIMNSIIRRSMAVS
ncbi:MarR family transcriptional regulator [Paraburkholderia sp. D1E]|uniref:MarR family transcriptional regulator n=1 Tax=Paraburkholderia sp. D1E TaxID=3461398 RepID=UPI0040454F2F